MLTLEIETDNEAFAVDSAAYECARILRSIAAKLEAGAVDGRAIDANGNAVGAWRLDA